MELRMVMTGVAPMVMQGDRLANPLDPIKLQIEKLTKKRNKTEEDWWEIYRLEFFGSMNYLAELGPYVKATQIEACLRDGAKRTRRGELVKRAVLCLDTEVPLIYAGPRDIDKLWLQDAKPDGSAAFRFLTSIVLKGSVRTMRMRPIFPVWSCEARIELDTGELNLEEFRDVAETAGRREGLGTYRPRHGRYSVSIETAGRKR